MKILWLTHRDIMHPQSGGAERSIFEIARRLTFKSHEIIWISTSWQHKNETVEVEGITIERKHGHLFSHLSSIQSIKKHNPDIIIDDLGHAIPWGSEVLTSKTVIVDFFHLHRRSLRGQVKWPLGLLIAGLELMYPVIYRRSSFVTESESSVGDLISLGISSNRVAMIRLGVDINKFKPSKKSSEPLLIYFAGFRDYKRPGEIVKILPQILKALPRTRLVMIGTGPSLPKVRKLAGELGVLNSIDFLGRVSDFELSEIISKAWVNIHTSETEGFGLSILEASASGTPTIAYSVPGVKDAIRDNYNGILIEDGNSRNFVEAIKGFLNDYNDCWVTKSRKVAEAFSWERTAKEWERFLESKVS